MTETAPRRSRRILVVDDAPEVLRDALAADEPWEVDAAHRGDEALERVRSAEAEGRPYAVAFVDAGPSRGDAIVRRLQEESPALEVVLCVSPAQRHRASVIVLARPFEPIEVARLARTLAEKAHLARTVRWLEASNRRLRIDLEERTRLEREQAQAQKFEALGRLAAGIVHELDSPLAHAAGGLELARGELDWLAPLLGRLRQGLAPADHELALLAETITDLPRSVEDVQAGLARIAEICRGARELGYPSPSIKESVDLNRPLSAALEVAKNAFKYHADVELRLEALPPVSCNEAELLQVFLNLIANAADACADAARLRGRRGRITVCSWADAQGVSVSIGDDGAGIPEAIRASVFDPFFTTKPVGEATGHGLSLARSLVVDKHGGTITFESGVGEGTTFTVRIPRAPAEVKEPRSSSALRDLLM